MLKIRIRNFAGSPLGYVLLAVCSFGASKDAPIKTIERIKHSILPVVCVDADENNRLRIVGIAGSGFFVDRLGRFLTAGHVLDDFAAFSKTRRPCNPAVYIPDHGWGKFEFTVPFQSFSFVNCVRDSAIDLAVCQPVENPFTSKRIQAETIAPVLFDTAQWPDGTPVIFTGFPLEYVSPITSSGYIASKMGITADSPGFDYVIDKESWPGASGSLMYLRNGHVIGIMLKGGINQGVGLGYARSASVIVDFLAKHPAAPPEQTKPATPK